MSEVPERIWHEMIHFVKIVADLKIPDEHPDDVPITGSDGAYITCGDVRRSRKILEMLK